MLVSAEQTAMAAHVNFSVITFDQSYEKKLLTVVPLPDSACGFQSGLDSLVSNLVAEHGRVEVSTRICEDVLARFYLIGHFAFSKRRFKYSSFGVSFTTVAP
jgi:hypothetical protein